MDEVDRYIVHRPLIVAVVGKGGRINGRSGGGTIVYYLFFQIIITRSRREPASTQDVSTRLQQKLLVDAKPGDWIYLQSWKQEHSRLVFDTYYIERLKGS